MNKKLSEDERNQDPIGRDELTLIELAFTPVGTRDGRDEISTSWVGTTAQGKQKEFFKEVTAGKYGLPGYMAEEVLIALMWVASRSGFSSDTVRTNPTELLKLMGRSTSGKDYQNLQNALDQLTSVYIKTNALWDTETKSYVESGFHIINQYKLATKPKSGKKLLTVSWNKDLFKIFRRQRFKRIDVQFYYSLRGATSKRLYRWLDKHLRRSGRAEIDVLHLAHVKLEISPNKKYVSQVMQALEPALNELAEREYCAWSKEESGTDSGWKLVFTKQKLAGLDAEGDAPPEQDEQEDLTQDLISRGVTEGVARELVAEHSSAQIARQLRHYDYERSRGRAPASPGWLRRAIEEDFGLPDELTSRLESELEDAKKEEEKTAREKAQEEENRRMQEAFDEAYRALSETEKKELEKEAVSLLDSFNRQLYAESGGEAVGPRALVRAHMRRLLLEDASA